jgi:hypothetical protein
MSGPTDDPPYVCPGCYAVAGPCLPGCIDDEIAREAEEERGRRYPCSACGDIECEYTWADECPGRDLRRVSTHATPVAHEDKEK